MRVCSTCKQSKPLNQFNRDKSRPRGHEYRCRVCANAKTRAQHTQRKADLEHIVNEGRKNGCVICGIKAPEVIQFHHVEKKGKDWCTSLGLLEEAKAELRKCVPLCANCHLQVHAGTVILSTDA